MHAHRSYLKTISGLVLKLRARSRCCSIAHQSHCGALNVSPFCKPGRSSVSSGTLVEHFEAAFGELSIISPHPSSRNRERREEARSRPTPLF